MSIFSRMTDIVNSNLNALLDKAEDPEKMVRLIIQEMEETLVEVRSTSARAIADRKDLERRVQWQQDEAGEWQRKAEVAVSKGRDDLAKGALVEAKKSTEQAESLHGELDVLNSTSLSWATISVPCRKRLKTLRRDRMRSLCEVRPHTRAWTFAAL